MNGRFSIDDDAKDEVRAKTALRRFIDAEARFLKKYVPGFQNAFITNIGRYLGIHNSRHPLESTYSQSMTHSDSHTFPDAVTKPKTKNFHWDNAIRPIHFKSLIDASCPRK